MDGGFEASVGTEAPAGHLLGHRDKGSALGLVRERGSNRGSFTQGHGNRY